MAYTNREELSSVGNAVIYLACYDTINAPNDDVDYQAYKLAAKIEPVAEVVNDVLDAFVDVLKQAADAIVNVFKHLGDALSNLFKGANWQRKCKRGIRS